MICRTFADTVVRSARLAVLSSLAVSGICWAQGPTLAPATLRSVSPVVVIRGEARTLTLDGVNLLGATELITDDPALTGRPLPGGSRNQIRCEIAVAPLARMGLHRISARTPNGVTGSVTLLVSAWPETSEVEATAEPPTAVKLPTLLGGALTTAGDADSFAFQGREGEALIFDVFAVRIRSRMSAVVTLRGPDGAIVGRARGVDRGADRGGDALLAAVIPADGTYTLRVEDFERAAGGDVYYRILASPGAVVTGRVPLGVPSTGGSIRLLGPGLGEGQVVTITPGAPGSQTLSEANGIHLWEPVTIPVGSLPEVAESPARAVGLPGAQLVSVPMTLNGTISRPGEVDYYRFRARRGETIVLETTARRLGSPLDSHLAVLDTKGKPVERCALRCVSETVLTLNDRDAASAGLRLLAWNDLSVNDLMYIRGEVVKLVSLPKGPDDDARFLTDRGVRAALFETTPSGHALNTPIYKVQAYPAGTRFAPNGMPVFRLHYENDDGGPSFQKDARVTFVAPADGEFVAAVRDARRSGGPNLGYRLTLRHPRPDFRLSLAVENPGVPVGSSIPIEVTAERLDGFDGPIDVRLTGVPSGFTVTETQIEAGEASATVLLSHAEQAVAPTGTAQLTLLGTATLDGTQVTRSFPVGSGSRLVVLPPADLVPTAPGRLVSIRPGTEQYVEIRIERRNGFKGRIPVELRNLPFGVRVLDVGLNGVLINETESVRTFTIICDPWVKPTQRVIYCTVRTETDSSVPTEVAAAPITLVVLPPAPRAEKAVR